MEKLPLTPQHSLKISVTFPTEENDLACIFVTQLYSEKSQDRL